MFNAFVNVSSSIDRFQDIQRSLQELAKKDVLVGVPQASSNRKDSKEVTNAELVYMHTHGVRKLSMRQENQEAMDSGAPYSQAYQMYLQSHGSPLWNSPPRPIIEPAIEAHKEELAALLRGALEKALDGRPFEVELQKAGMKGQNVTRAWFTDPRNGWAPNSPVTIAKKGSSIPLIDTAEMRKSITWVLRDKE